MLLPAVEDGTVSSKTAETARFVGGLPQSPQRRLAYYRDGYHLLLRDLAGATVAGDIANWVFDRRAPLPSQADRRDEARRWPPQAESGG